MGTVTRTMDRKRSMLKLPFLAMFLLVVLSGCYMPIRFDAETYTCIGDDDANQYLARPEYRSPWTLPRLEDV